MLKVSVIISTYNKSDFLEKVLWGYSNQTYTNFEILIADDGSSQDHQSKNKSNLLLNNLKYQYVYHNDDGFRKCRILNQAILQSKGEYLIFSDGDCIPDQDFVKKHVLLAEKNKFLSGGHIPLSKKNSSSVSKNDIISQQVFKKSFLFKKGEKISKKYLKLIKNSFIASILDKVTITKPTFNGNNSSAWKKDILEVNGFDERMKYGGLDCEMGYRLNNLGIKGKQIRHQCSPLHLYHKRPYKNDLDRKANRVIRLETISSKKTFTNHGIEQTQ